MRPFYLMIATLAAVLAVVANSAQFKKECEGRSMRECVAELIDWTTGRTATATYPAPAPSVNDSAAPAGNNWDAAPDDSNVIVPDGSTGDEAPASDTGVQSGSDNRDNAPPNESPQN